MVKCKQLEQANEWNSSPGVWPVSIRYYCERPSSGSRRNRRDSIPRVERKNERIKSDRVIRLTKGREICRTAWENQRREKLRTGWVKGYFPVTVPIESDSFDLDPLSYYNYCILLYTIYNKWSVIDMNVTRYNNFMIEL